MGTHVGSYDGALAGEVTLTVSRVDEANLVEVKLGGGPGVVLATAELESESARAGGCSDMVFDGDLVDDTGAAIGRFEGALTTTTGQGTWSFDSGEEGTWALGSI